VNIPRLMIRSALRSLRRTLMTVMALVASLVAFILLRTLSGGWTDQVSQTPRDRVAIRHRLGWEQSLAMQDVEVIRQLPGVEGAVAARFADVALPAQPSLFFGALAVEAQPFIDTFHELIAPPDQEQAFISSRRGAFVSELLARELGWSLGDTLHLTDKRTSRDLELTVVGIYRSTRKGFANRTLWFHWEYYDELSAPAERGQVTTVTATVSDPERVSSVAHAIDVAFDSRARPTFSQPDQALRAALVGRFGALLAALQLVSWLILGIVLLIVANAVAISTRERTREYALLRAIGFLPRHLWGLVVGEAAALGLIGGLLAALLSAPLAHYAFARVVGTKMGLSGVEVSLGDAVLGLAAGAAVAVLATLAPLRGFLRVPVVDALRRIQ
jgi:putative ABC transport system permease protein